MKLRVGFLEGINKTEKKTLARLSKKREGSKIINKTGTLKLTLQNYKIS